mgnify:CR=1 FL=1
MSYVVESVVSFIYLSYCLTTPNIVLSKTYCNLRYGLSV